MGKITLYHGSAQFEEILAKGLLVSSGYETDFGDTSLDSLGGVYLSDSLEAAAFYANRATSSEMSHGLDPCVFIVEVESCDLAADEDKIASVLERVMGVYGWHPDEGDHDEIIEYLNDKTGNRSFLSSVRREFGLPTGFVDREISDAVTAFVLRKACWDWNVGDGSYDAEIEAINAFCRQARQTLSPEWFARQFDQYVMTCRTFADIGHSPDAPSRIVGSIRLCMSVDGLTVEGIETDGCATQDQANEFLQDFIEHASHHGVEILDASTSQPKAA